MRRQQQQWEAEDVWKIASTLPPFAARQPAAPKLTSSAKVEAGPKDGGGNWQLLFSSCARCD